MRGGLWSSFSVPGRWYLRQRRAELDARHMKGRATEGVACTPLQVQSGLKLLVGRELESADASATTNGRLPVGRGR